MTIRIELDDVLEQRLSAEAEQHGVGLETYAERLLRGMMDAPTRVTRRATAEEFRGFLDAMASKTPEVPHLRTTTFSREMIYGEHD